MIRTCDIRFVMRDREREREPGRRPVSAPCPGPVIGWARSRVLTTCHTGGHLSAVYSCTVRCTAVQLSHQQHHYIPTPSVCQQLWKQPDVSYKVTFCPGLTCHLWTTDTWLRSVLLPWMTLMKNFICGYLDSDNHHDIVSIFWLEKK